MLVSSNPDCIITQIGLNDIELNRSSISQVIQEFRDTPIEKKWQKSIEIELFGHYEYTLDYPEKGYSFIAEKVKGDKIVTSIILSKSCDCVTKEGIGIGSSYQDIVRAIGQPYFNNDIKKPSIHYEPNMYYDNNVLLIHYKNFQIRMNNSDTSKAFIQRIWIY